MRKFEKEDGRLSKEEAAAYQSYAAAKEGLKFSERAAPEAEAEAEIFLSQLKDKKFDWLGIDWDKIDFSKIENIKDVEQRLDIAARIALEKGETGLTVKDFLKNHKSVMTLAMSVGLLLSPACGKVDSAQYERNIAAHNHIVEKAKKAGVNGLVLAYEPGKEQEFSGYIDLINRWKKEHPEIRTVALIDARDNGEGGDKDFRFFAGVSLRSIDGIPYNAYVATGGSIEEAIAMALKRAREHMSKERTVDARRNL